MNFNSDDDEEEEKRHESKRSKNKKRGKGDCFQIKISKHIFKSFPEFKVGQNIRPKKKIGTE